MCAYLSEPDRGFWPRSSTRRGKTTRPNRPRFLPSERGPKCGRETPAHASTSAQVATFGGATDRAGLAAAFACGDVLVVDGLGEGATCYFEDAYTLRVVPGAASAAAPGGRAWLRPEPRPRGVRAFPGPACWAAAAGGEATAVVVAAPPDAVEPAVALAAPAAVAACGAVAVDILASTGDGGRPWADVVWTVPAGAVLADGARGAPSATLADVSAFAGGELAVSVEATNFLGGADAASATIEVRRGAVPDVVVPGDFSAERRGDVVELVAEAAASACPGEAPDSARLAYAWASTAGGEQLSEPNKFRLPAHATAAAFVDVAVTVTDKLGRENAASARVTYAPSPLEAAIAGADRRSVAVGAVAELDGAGSRDPDVAAGAPAALAYAWSCVDPAGGSCGAASTATFAFTPAAAGDHVVTLAVSGGGRVAEATAELDAAVVVDPRGVPDVGVVTAFERATASGLCKFQADVGGDYVDDGISYVWRVVEGALEGSLASVAASPASGDVIAYRLVSLDVPCDALTAAGGPYGMELSAKYADGDEEARAVVRYAPASPPKAGELRVDPPGGVEATDLFQLSLPDAASFVPDRPKLEYAFFESDEACESEACEFALVQRGPSSRPGPVTLSAGLAATAGEAARKRVVAYVWDADGTRARAEAWVDVVPLADLGAVEEAAAEAIEEALETDDVDELVNAIHQTATMLQRLAAVDAATSAPSRAPTTLAPTTPAPSATPGAPTPAPATLPPTTRSPTTREPSRAPTGAAARAEAEAAAAAALEIKVEVVAELIDAFEAVVELQADTADEQETINTRAMIADAVTADVEALEAQAPEEQEALAETVAGVVSSLRDVPVAVDAAASFLKTLGRLDGLGLFAGSEKMATPAYGGAAAAPAAAARRLEGAPAAAEGAPATFASLLDDVAASLLVEATPGADAADVDDGAGLRLVATRLLASTTGASASGAKTFKSVNFYRRVGPDAKVTTGSDDADVSVVRYARDPHPSAATPVLSEVRRVGVGSGAAATFKLSLPTTAGGDAALDATLGDLPPARNETILIVCGEPTSATYCEGAVAAADVAADVCAGWNASTRVAVALSCAYAATVRCEVFDEGGGDWVDAAGCAVDEASSDSAQTTCACAAAPGAPPRDYAALSSADAYAAYAATSFNAPLSTSLLTQSWVVFSFMASCAAVWLAFAAVGHALDRRFERREAAREAAASRAAATKARRPSSARQRTRLHQLEKSLAKQKLKAQLTPTSSARDLKAHARSVHRAVLRASLPSVVTKHRLVRRTLRHPDEAEAKSFKELRLVLWTVYYNHSWFSIASVYSRDHPRWRRCLLAFFETMIIAVCEAVTAWVSYPVGLCKVADDAASCENIRSSTSFGTDNNCRWDASTEPECVFDPPRGSGDIFFMRLQMAVVSVAITLPLLKFANWIFDSYVFAPVVTAAELAARRRRGSTAGGAPSEVVAGRQLLANLGMDEAPDPRYKRDDRLTRFLQRAFGGSAAAKEVKRARTAERIAHAYASLARWQTMRLVLRQRQEIRDAIADLDDGVYDGAVAPPPRRGAAPAPAAAEPDIAGTVAAAGGATFDRRALLRRTANMRSLRDFLDRRAASPYRSALVALLRHHGAYWHLDPDAFFWQRTFATRVHAVLMDSITVASRWIDKIHDGDAAHAKRLLALYQLKVAEELHGIERDLFYRHCYLEAVKDTGAAGADAVSPNARRAAVGVVCLALVGMGYFMLFFARAYDRGSMQENWLYATVMTMFLIIFVFENLRSLILLIYLPALLVPKLRHIRDPLHVPLVPFRHETPVTPVQLVDVREARAVLKASAVPRRLHARLGTARRESGLFVSTDDPTDVPRPRLWRAAADRWARFRDRLFEDDDELIVDADHDDRDVNRDFRRGHAAGWSLDNVRERLGYVNWERPRLHAAALVCGGFVMRLHQEFQELFLEETANLLTIIVASVSGEVFDVFRRGRGSATEARRRGASVMVFSFLVVFALVVYVARACVYPVLRRACRRLARALRPAAAVEAAAGDGESDDDDDDGAADAYFRRADREDEDLFSDDSDVDLVPRRDDYDSDDDDLAEQLSALETTAFQQNIHVRFDRESSLASRPGDGDDDAGDGAAPDDEDDDDAPAAEVAPAASTARRVGFVDQAEADAELRERRTANARRFDPET